MIDPNSGDYISVPPFCTLEQALTRATLERARELREIRLTAAWGNEWPLWEATNGPRSPQDLELSDGLAEKLKTWTEAWYSVAERAIQQDIDVSEMLPREWFTDGDLLTRELAIELWPIGDIIPSYLSYLPHVDH
ncbi:hypothetical protein ACXR2W_08585 [Leucobacter sp. HY1908]